MKLKNILILLIISNKTNSNQKNRDQIRRKNKSNGCYENLDSQALKLRMREKIRAKKK
jgi:hypothetical protein